MPTLPTDPLLGLITGYTSSPPTLVPASDMNRVRLLLANFYKVFVRDCVQEGILRNETHRCVFDDATNRIAAPGVGEEIIGIANGIPIIMDSGMERDGTVQSATTTTLTDTSLAATTNYWVRAWVVFTSGDNDGVARQVTAYDNSIDKVTLSPALSTAPTAGDTYTITFYYVDGLTSDAVNYIFAGKGTDTIDRGIAVFTAATSATPGAGQILVSAATLDSSGVCTLVDDETTGVARDLFPGVGGYTTLSGSGSIELDADEVVDIDIAHDQLLYVGDLQVALDDAYTLTGTLSVVAHYGSSAFTIRITNTSESTDTFSYTWSRSGRKLQYAS